MYNIYNNNYYNSLINYINTQYINDNIIKIKLKDKYEEVINIIKQKINKDKKMKEIEDKKDKEINEKVKKVSEIYNNKSKKIIS